MLIFMHATIANPEVILRAGKVYDAPNRIAKAVMKQTLIGNVSWNDDTESVDVSTGGPAAVPYDERKHGKKPVLRIPARPDPEDRADVSDEEDFEELQDE